MVVKTLYTFMSGRLTDGLALHPFLLANAPRSSMFPACTEGPMSPCCRLHYVGTIKGVRQIPQAEYTTAR